MPMTTGGGSVGWEFNPLARPEKSGPLAAALAPGIAPPPPARLLSRSGTPWLGLHPTQTGSAMQQAAGWRLELFFKSTAELRARVVPLLRACAIRRINLTNKVVCCSLLSSLPTFSVLLSWQRARAPPSLTPTRPPARQTRDDQLLEAARVLCEELPGIDVCVHYSCVPCRPCPASPSDCILRTVLSAALYTTAPAYVDLQACTSHVAHAGTQRANLPRLQDQTQLPPHPGRQLPAAGGVCAGIKHAEHAGAHLGAASQRGAKEAAGLGAGAVAVALCQAPCALKQLAVPVAAGSTRTARPAPCRPSAAAPWCGSHCSCPPTPAGPAACVTPRAIHAAGPPVFCGLQPLPA